MFWQIYNMAISWSQTSVCDNVLRGNRQPFTKRGKNCMKASNWGTNNKRQRWLYSLSTLYFSINKDETQNLLHEPASFLSDSPNNDHRTELHNNRFNCLCIEREKERCWAAVKKRDSPLFSPFDMKYWFQKKEPHKGLFICLLNAELFSPACSWTQRNFRDFWLGITGVEIHRTKKKKK